MTGKVAVFLAVLAVFVLFGMGGGSYEVPRWIAIYLLVSGIVSWAAWRLVNLDPHRDSPS